MPHTLVLTVPFPEARLAECASRVLAVDAELKPKEISRTFTTTKEGALEVTFTSDNLKLIRVSANGILEHLQSVMEAMAAFDPK